ncbi:ATP-dependent Clp protease proteolytic subunit [Variovorax robiniae]|uniref:ATP-dependent Clp protease proteolytic subunit n=1 Tax=Variovorax robiniae TaxID=1836199 RepID=A0ABU8XFK4_9BURK
MSISIHPSTNSGALLLSGEITEDVALRFESCIELLFAYYRYDQITVEINSPGGQVTALEHMLASLERWRGLGRQVGTKASFRAGSAAAMLLAMGDIGSRSASGSTTLLFHSARIDGANAMFTASAATSLGTLLQGKDLLHLERLVGHQVRGFGGWHALAAEGAARCEHLIKRSGSRTSRSAGQPPVTPFGSLSLATLARSFRHCQERQSIAPYRRMLSRRFAEDRAMSAAEAWALCLIDSVLDRPDLQPSSKPLSTAPDDPVVSAMRPGM